MKANFVKIVILLVLKVNLTVEKMIALSCINHLYRKLIILIKLNKFMPCLFNNTTILITIHVFMVRIEMIRDSK